MNMNMNRQPYLNRYPNLFTPLIAGRKQIQFKNRIFTAPMHTSVFVDSNNMLSEMGIEFFGGKARGGAGCVCLGEAQIDHTNSSGDDCHIELTREANLQQLHKFNEYAHAYGARTSIELNHNGVFSQPRFGDGSPPMSASALTMPNGNTVREMTETDMERVADAFAAAALMARRAQFDMVTVHLGHGWLLSNFLSDLINKRKDQYGGSLENKMRFPKMVLEYIRERVGSDMLIEVRICGSEETPGGIEIGDTIAYIRMIEPLIDLVHISCGTMFNAVSRAEMHPSQFLGQGHNAPWSEQVKKTGIQIPVGVVGGISDPEVAEKILSDGQADYIVIGRATVADPDWSEKVRAGRESDIRPCIRCNRCIDAGSFTGVSTAVLRSNTSSRKSDCSVNPLFGLAGYKERLPTTKDKKLIAVVGGGPAGMQAALSAAERGHRVSLFERSGTLGGKLLYADHVWFKKDLAKYRNYLAAQVMSGDINVCLNTEATPSLLEKENFDAVIVAIGAAPVTPPIPGVGSKNVIQALDVFGKEYTLGKRIVIVGGGLAGCELSIHLSGKGHDCTVVEKLEHLAPDGQLSERLHVLKYMDLAKVMAYTGMNCTEITDEEVICSDADGHLRNFKADTVVLCTGMKPLATERDSFARSAYDVINIGDCAFVGNVRNAIHSGYDASLRLGTLNLPR
jgi:2,4-dienoyl-CoA reductase-like NADH-dependent reductase (Old Yellow Enzyme family)